MLASRMLTSASLHHEGGSGIGGRIGAKLGGLYKRCLNACLNAPWLVVLVAVLFAGLAVILFGTIRQELTPSEDRSMVLLRVSAPQGVSLDYTAAQMRTIEQLIEPMRMTGEIESTFQYAGNSGNYNSGFMVITLAPWDKRSRSQQEIWSQINALTRQMPAIRVFPIQPNSLGIRGAGNGLQFALVGNDRATLSAIADNIIATMEQDPRFEKPRLSIDPSQPQLSTSTGGPLRCRPCSTATRSATSSSATARSASNSSRPPIRSTTRPIWRTCSSGRATAASCQCRPSPR
jgi:HAE1 family hydrophobic/amphiphilic exporter-1